jgi:aspartate racemase
MYAIEVSNQAEKKTQGFRCAQQLFEEQAKRRPEAIAVRCGDDRLTYVELNARASELASRLRERGVRPGDLISIAVERSVQMAVAILASLKSGAAYLLLDPGNPAEWLSFMLSDAQPKLLITESDLVSSLPRGTIGVVLISDTVEASHSPTHVNAASQSDPAYVIYTTGSLGQRKGVVITHNNLTNNLQSLRVAVGLNPSDIYLHTASISFSSSVRQLLLPLTTGATVIIATPDEIRDAITLFELVKKEGVTVIDIVPSYWRGCVTALEGLPTGERRELLGNKLRLILSASEPLFSDLPRIWRNRLQHPAALINMYGQTETAGIVATYSIVVKDQSPSSIVPIGVPIDKARIYLLDSGQRRVPYGACGEICIGGPTVGLAYLNQPRLSADKFVGDPFSRSSVGRLYRTGDLGRLRLDGCIEFLGRLDSQLKIRAQRVESRQAWA